MASGAILALALTITGANHVDPTTSRQVYEAVRQANAWSNRKAEALLPLRNAAMARTRDARGRYLRLRGRAIDGLLDGSLAQIGRAYKLSRKEIAAIMTDPRVPKYPFVSVRRKPGAASSLGVYSTRFDPAEVVLPEKLATDIGWSNPRSPEERAAEIAERAAKTVFKDAGDAASSSPVLPSGEVAKPLVPTARPDSR